MRRTVKGQDGNCRHRAPGRGDGKGEAQPWTSASQVCPTWPMAMPKGQLITKMLMAVAISRPSNQSAAILVK